MPVDIDIELWLDRIETAGLYMAIALFAVFLIFVLRRLIGLVYQFRVKRVVLEITPPAISNKMTDANESVFTALHGLEAPTTVFERFVGIKPVFSAEIVAERKTGIRFFLLTPANHTETVEALIATYVADAKVSRVQDDYTHSFEQRTRIVEFVQTKHYGFPLKRYDELPSDDPVGYVTGAMTKLKDDEKIVFQVVFSPAHVSEAMRLSKKILRNDHVISEMSSRGGTSTILNILSSLSVGLIDLMSDVLSPSSSSYSSHQNAHQKQQTARALKPARTLSSFEQELVESVHGKLSNPLFKTSVRTYISSPSKQNIKKRQSAIRSAVSLFNVPKYQALKMKRRKMLMGKKLLQVLFEKRMLSLKRSPMYLSSSELAGLYHFPHSESVQTENVIKSLSKTLPAPVSLKNGTELDVSRTPYPKLTNKVQFTNNV